MLPREKLQVKGVGFMTDVELVAAIIGTGTKNIDFMSVADSVVELVQNSGGKDINIELLENVKGVGVAKAIKILAGIELGKRVYSEDRNKVVIQTSEDAYANLKDLASMKQEHVVVILLNARYELIDMKTIGIGTVNKASVSPRDVLIPALEANAVGVVMAHNHPSGDCSPSQDDLFVTKRIAAALELVGIQLFDHIVVSVSGWASIPVSQGSKSDG